MNDDRATILVDVDGTLVDTNYFHAVAWWRAFRDIGEAVPMSKIHPLIGMGSDQLVHRLIGRESEEASDAHSRHYEPFKKEIIAFPKAADFLAELSSRGARVVLATSSDEEDLKRLREAVGADDSIDDAISKGDVEQSKPSPDIFEAALKRFDVDPARALVVGDTPWDVEAAGKLDLRTVCVLTGGATREQLDEAGAVAVYEDVAELLANLDVSPLSKLLDG
ncbi:MAG TPA: HAD family hydrolase [Acidimicrobiales bacterium]|nr:HAD family hydrolase [Acidimicrobiales bacterium]